MNIPPEFQHLDSPDEWVEAFPIMQELRPHLRDATCFAKQVQRQHEEHYRLLAARDASGAIFGLAGYRLQMNTLYGRFLYVDDLIVTARQQRSGLGAGLLDQVRAIASRSACTHLVLDTGLHMPFAQRFYFRNGLLAKGMHFVESLQPIHKEAAQ